MVFFFLRGLSYFVFEGEGVTLPTQEIKVDYEKSWAWVVKEPLALQSNMCFVKKYTKNGRTFIATDYGYEAWPLPCRKGCGCGKTKKSTK